MKNKGKKGTTEEWTLSKAFKGRTSWEGTTRGLLRSSAIDCQFDLWPRPRRGLLKQERTTPSHGFCKGDLIAFRGVGTTREREGQKAGVCSFSQSIRETQRADGSGACSPFFLLQRAFAQAELWPESEIYVCFPFGMLHRPIPPRPRPPKQHKTKTQKDNKASFNNGYDSMTGQTCSLTSVPCHKKELKNPAYGQHKKISPWRNNPPTHTHTLPSTLTPPTGSVRMIPIWSSSEQITIVSTVGFFFLLSFLSTFLKREDG